MSKFIGLDVNVFSVPRYRRNRLVKASAAMGCKQCQKNRQRSLERRRQLMEQKRERLTSACEQGDERSCRELHNIGAAEAYRAANQYIPELHRRAA